MNNWYVSEGPFSAGRKVKSLGNLESVIRKHSKLPQDLTANHATIMPTNQLITPNLPPIFFHKGVELMSPALTILQKRT